MDMEELTSKILYIDTLHPNGLLLLECTYERLILLCQQQNSPFLKPNIFPALK